MVIVTGHASGNVDSQQFQSPSRSQTIEADGDDEELPHGHDLLCGPRCVQFLLQYYQRSPAATLVALTREIQWPDVEAGVSLERIAEALKARSIHTAALKLSSDATLKWNHPVVVHLAPRDQQALGHYVIWLPDSTEGICRVWSGTPGMQIGSWSELRAGMSGVVLLTSPEPITEDEVAAGVQRSTAFSRFITGRLFEYFLFVFPVFGLGISLLLLSRTAR
jgi:ABC-type bacteriocin/lantibiotic exporter with double-glycine peptidase domain